MEKKCGKEAADRSVILPFHFLFGPLSIKQEIEENILHLAGSIEMGQALWTGETF